MSHVLAAIPADDDAELVSGAAGAIADVIDTAVRKVQIAGDIGAAAAADVVLEELRDADCVMAALRCGTIDQELCWAVLQDAGKPVVLVPQEEHLRNPAISAALVPLDGSGESSAAVADIVDLMARAGVDVIVLHVFEPASVPAFWDHPTHAADAWRSEFLARSRTPTGLRMELRNGMPGENVLDVARIEAVDLVALAWSQNLDAGRAITVRHTVADAAIPVMLVPGARSE